MKIFFYEGEINRVFCEKYDIIEQMDECSKRELFIAAVQTLTQEEQRRLWKELEKHGIIKRKSPDCI